ncbi:DNA polymerase III subunit delta [Anaplasma capra]|uniref:DNA polymerase III subunit delta n=1 Tax=Anaplasma capra TaxID=1562740 RepID=UPI0021D5E48A|nr:DNA polymerase III subunit delta [Anaplasma capra]MCU7611117.1 DNA polymerase III subunit delta [Anaplasma capra]MCU7612379.1 DNA polymerase III subunit delta [Anaplasma capra]
MTFSAHKAAGHLRHTAYTGKLSCAQHQFLRTGTIVKITASKLGDFFGNPEAYGSMLFHGNDCSRASMYIQKILHQVNRNGEFAIHKMEFLKANKDPEQLLVNLMTIPMFSKKPLVLLTDAKDGLSSDLKAAMESVNPQHCHVIVQARELSGASSLKDYYNTHKRFASIGCYKEEDASFIVADFLSRHSISYEQRALRLLCDTLRHSSACLQPELEKLLLYLGTKKSLSTEDIQKSLASDLDPALDDLCVAIADGNLGDVLKFTDALFQNKVSPMLVIRSSMKYFVRLECLSRRTHHGENIDNVIKTLQPPVFFRLIPKLRRHVASVAYETIQVILRRLLEAEIQCKISDTTQEVVFKYLMCSLATFVKHAENRQYKQRATHGN